MMAIPPSEAKALTWWEYGALLTTWNARHDPDGAGEAVEAPDADTVARQRQKLMDRGLIRTVH